MSLSHEGYFIEKEVFERLRRIEQRLHGGSDAMRDEGHKLWLVLNDLPKVELFAHGEEWDSEWSSEEKKEADK
jgi:hypothetical protein